ncbi:MULTISPECIES: transporter [unclassified Ensifer]|uniref:SphA family protein n=1 Tax=unclassified Ensifer TaxID=2633371 RepID=UPI000AF9E360|nr:MULTISPECIES: transporter [unclassified Ensifer]
MMHARSLLSASAVAAGLTCAIASPAEAAENGAGFYLLGARGPMAGLLAPPGTYFQNDTYFYVGELKGNRQLPLGGEIVGEVDATLVGIFGTGLWVMPEEVLGGNLGFTAIVPFGGPNIDATLSAPRAGRSASVSDSVFTIGDPVLGATLGWHEGDFHWTANASVNVPIGDYQKGELANLSFNRWAGDLTFAGTWLNPETGLDLSGAAGFTFNGENPATDYRTGTEFHAEWAVTQHFSPQFSAGVAGYFYQQVTGDSGPGARLGAFKGRIAALGGTMGYNFKAGETPVSLTLKVFQEFAAKNRPVGTAGFVTIAFPIGTPPAPVK